jgi:hypothetical protein
VAAGDARLVLALLLACLETIISVVGLVFVLALSHLL